MPFMRSESCSFIWQPKVVTWNDFIASGGYFGIEGGARFPLGRLMHGMRARTTPPDRKLADLARRQYGVVSRRQVLALGIDRGGIERRLAAGRLHRMHRGVYAVGHTIVNGHGRWLAAVMACG